MMSREFQAAIESNNLRLVLTMLLKGDDLITDTCYVNDIEHTCLMLALRSNAHLVFTTLISLSHVFLPNEEERRAFINFEMPVEEITVFNMLFESYDYAGDYFPDDIVIGGAQLLMNAGADINHRSHSGFTAVYSAIYQSNLALLTWLVEQGASINSTWEPCTVLSAIFFERDELSEDEFLDVQSIFNYLIAIGADINEREGDVLRNAVYVNSPELWHLIFTHNVRLFADYSQEEKTRILTTAIECNATHIVRDLIRNALDVNSPEFLRLIFTRNVKVVGDYSPEEKAHMLAIAIECNATHIARDLILIGASFTANDELVARQNDFQPMLRMLLGAEKAINRINRLASPSSTMMTGSALCVFNTAHSATTWLTRKDAVNWMSTCKAMFFSSETEQREDDNDRLENPHKRMRV